MKTDSTPAIKTKEEAKRRLIQEMIAEALAGPYVHEECGDTLWDDALAEHAAKPNNQKPKA